MRVTASSRADQAFIGHVDGDLERRLGGALAGARLQHPQPAVLDGEFQVLHVAIMLLEPRESRRQARRRFRASALSSEGALEPASMRAASVMFCGVRMPATTSSPWALTRNSP